MTLDSRIKRIAAVGALGAALLFNPLSSNDVQAQTQDQDSGYFSDADITALLAAIDKNERESHITSEDKAYDDQWINRMIAEVYFPLSRKYDADTVNTIIRVYAPVGIAIDSNRLKSLEKTADVILSDPYIKTMPKDIAGSVIIASGSWIEKSRQFIDAAKFFSDSLSKKGIDFRKDPSGLCAMIEAYAETFISPESILKTYLSYDSKPIDRKDFIKAFAYSMYTKTRPADTKLTSRYGTDCRNIQDAGTSLINDFRISVPLAGKLLQTAVIADMNLSEIIDQYQLLKDIVGKHSESIFGDMILPYRYSSGNMNKKRLAENFMYVVDTLADRGFDEKTVRAMIQSYSMNPAKK